jgi:hypothetical protein
MATTTTTTNNNNTNSSSNDANATARTTMMRLAAHAQVFEAAGLTPAPAGAPHLLSHEALLGALKAPALIAAAQGLFEGLRALAERQHGAVIIEPALPETLNTRSLLAMYLVVYRAPETLGVTSIMGAPEQALVEASTNLLRTFEALRSALLSSTAVEANADDKEEEEALLPSALTLELLPQIDAMVRALNTWKGPGGVRLLQRLDTTLKGACHARALLVAGLAPDAVATVADLDGVIANLRGAIARHALH